MEKANRPGRNGGRLNTGFKDPVASAKAPRKLPDIKDALANLLGAQQKDQTALDAMLIVLFKNALAGDVASMKLLLAYGYGNPTQRLEHTGDGGSPMQIVVQVTPPDVTLNTDPE